MLKKVILFVILACFGTNLFPQQNNDAWKWWRKNAPATDFYVSLVVYAHFVLAAGEGSKLYEINSGSTKEFSDLNMGPQIDIIDMANDPNSNDVLVLAEDGYGEFYLLSVSLDGKVKELTTTDEPLYSVSEYNNMTYITGNGEIITSTDKKQFTHQHVPDLEEVNDVIGIQPADYLLLGKSKAGNDNGIRTTTDFMNYNTPIFGWRDPINFEKASSFEGFTASGRTAKTLQIAPIFATGYQAATNSYVVCRSTDDGATWDSVFASSQLYSLPALSEGSNSNVIIGGNSNTGKLYYTKDGGVTWSPGYDAPGYIYSITHVSADSAYAFGAQGLILLTTNGGVNWTQISDEHPSVSTIYFPSPSMGYAAGLSGPFPSHVLNVYKTTDAGDNWNVIYADSSFSPSNAFLNSIYFIDDMTGYIAGSKLLKTTDGGVHWDDLNTGTSSIIQNVFFVNNSLGFAAHGDGAIKTTDGGNTWNPLNMMNMDFDKKYVYFADENLGFISGDSVLYRTTDGGDTWKKLSVGTNNEDLNSKVTFINSSTGFFGKKGQVFKTTDKGDTWTDAAIDNHTVPQQIQFISDSIGYFISTSDTFGIHSHILYKTTDGGNSWFDLTNELPSTGIFSLFFTDENTGYLAGKTGILKTTSGGEGIVTSVQQEDNVSIPSDFKLYQNYPNPFNPSTTIKFAIPKESYTKLEIFNILGEKVTTLVSEMLSPGAYKYKWDAGRYSSGVYFYRIIADSFIQTKKLLLVK